MRQKSGLFLIIILTLALASCTFQFETTVNSDGSGETAIAMGLTAEDKSALEAFSDGELTDICSEVDFLNVPGDVTFTQEDRGDETWCVVTESFSNLDELRADYTETDIRVNRLEFTEDRFYFDIDFDLSEASQEDVEMLGTMGMEFNFVWILTVPGNVGANNANEVSGQTLTWNLPMGSIVNLQAESSLGGGFSSIILIVVLVGLAILGVLLVIELRKGRGGPSPDQPLDQDDVTPL